MEFLVEQRQLLVPECTRGESNFAGLLLKGLQNPGMTVSLVHRGIRSQAIEVTSALDVIYPNAFRTLNHHFERMIVMSSILVLEFDEVLGMQWLLYELRRHTFLSQVDICELAHFAFSLFPKASSAAPCAHKAHTSPGGSTWLVDRHRPTCLTPPCVATDEGSGHPPSCAAARSSQWH